jgi:hypothetical protein
MLGDPLRLVGKDTYAYRSFDAERSCLTPRKYIRDAISQSHFFVAFSISLFLYLLQV